MTIERAMRLASQWASGGVCTLREGEAKEYHKVCYEALKALETPGNDLVKRRVAREIIDIIKLVCFSEEYRDYRIRYGSRGQRDLILNMIEERYLKQRRNVCP